MKYLGQKRCHGNCDNNDHYQGQMQIRPSYNFQVGFDFSDIPLDNAQSVLQAELLVHRSLYHLRLP